MAEAGPAARNRWRYALAAAAVVLAGASAAGGYVAGRSNAPPSARVASGTRTAAKLQRLPGGPANVAGRALVRSTRDGRQVTVTTAGLPLRTGYYEVWLFDPDRGPGGDMLAVGALGDGGQGTFTLPAGVDLRAYRIVNVSAQDYGGGVKIVHAQSVLQGSLTE